MDINQAERESQEHPQPPLPAASREWEDGDIDWGCLQVFLDSLLDVADGSADPHRNVLYAAIQRLHVVAREIQRLDPRFAKSGEGQ